MLLRGRGVPLARVGSNVLLVSLHRSGGSVVTVMGSMFITLSSSSSPRDRRSCAQLVEWSGSTTVGRLFYVALVAFSTVATAWLSWHLLEKHFLKLKRYFPMNGANQCSSIAAPQVREITTAVARRWCVHEGAGYLTRHRERGMNGGLPRPAR